MSKFVAVTIFYCKMTDKKHKKSIFARRRLWISAGIIFLILAVAGVITGVSYLTASYNGDRDMWLYIPRDATAGQIEKMLSDSLGNTGKKAAFMWKSAKGTPQKAHGAYKIERGDKAVDIAKRLKRGGQTPITFTFNNIRTLGQLAHRADEKFEMDSAAFIKACDSILVPAGFSKNTYIAAFLPDSYQFYWTASPEKIVNTLLEHRNNFWNDERRASAKSLGLSPMEVATLASIAEEETNSSKERPVVARLYLNRLRKGMKLQADPTVKFAVGDFSLRRITGAHLGVASRYNTYMYEGLPPGPIRMADPRTLDAVLKSAPNDYIYMCAKEDFSGLHNFTSSYAEHQKNAQRYRAELNRRNIK